jgi:phosphate acetyltransferase
MAKSAIFIGATGQNVGKTTICLGIIAALKKRFTSVGFIKPVGQQHVKIAKNINVDKDVVLFKEHFLLEASWSDMSPVIIPSGFTRDFLDEKITEIEMQSKIKHSYNTISNSNDYTVVEGTGHVGVGSIVNLNNAKVAYELGLDMVIIGSGGLGSAHDELALNIAMCQKYGVKVRGIILNRVLEAKKEMIMEYFPKTLKKWGIPLIGCIPYNELLSNPTVKDFEFLFGTAVVSGEKHRYRHFRHTRLVAGSLESYREEMIPNELVITPATREDIIMITVHKHLETLKVDGFDFSGGMILTGRHPPRKEILDQIKDLDIPILYAPVCSYDAMKMITSFTAKIRNQDVVKVEKAISLVEENIDFEILCNGQIDKKNLKLTS